MSLHTSTYIKYYIDAYDIPIYLNFDIILIIKIIEH